MRDIEKVLGFSYIKIDGILHKFISGDQNHSSQKERSLQRQKKSCIGLRYMDMFQGCWNFVTRTESKIGF